MPCPYRNEPVLRTCQSVDAVEGRRAVALGEGGIVEDVVDEEVHLAPVREDCLADVDQLGGAVTDDVHAEQLQRDAIEDELQQAFQVTDDLPARNLLVEGAADLVRHPFLGQFFLALAYRGDLGDRVDALGQHLGQCGLRYIEGVATGQPALLHGGRGQRRKADHVPGGVDVRHFGLVVLVHLELARLVRGDARGGQVQHVGVGDPPHGVQQYVRDDGLAALEGSHDAALFVGRDLVELLPQPHRHAVSPHVVDQGLDDLLVHEPQQVIPYVEEGDLDPERREHRGVLAADHASTHDDHALGNHFRGEDRIRIAYRHIVEWDLLRPPRARPGGDQDERRSERILVAALGDHSEGVRVRERGRALDDLHVVPLELVGDDLQLVPNDQVLARHQVPERHVLFQGVSDVGEGAELEPVQVVDRVLEGLARQRTGVDARAAEHPLLLDDGHTLAQLGRLDGGLLAGGTAADHQQVEFTH